MATTKTDAADLVARAVVAGVDLDAAIVATGQSVPSADRHPFRKDIAPEHVTRWLAEARVDRVALFNRSERDALESAIVAAEQAAVAPAEQPTTDEPMATPAQIAYIQKLRARRAASGETRGFMSYDGDPAKLTRRQASSYINSLTGEY